MASESLLLPPGYQCYYQTTYGQALMIILDPEYSDFLVISASVACQLVLSWTASLRGLSYSYSVSDSILNGLVSGTGSKYRDDIEGPGEPGSEFRGRLWGLHLLLLVWVVDTGDGDQHDLAAAVRGGPYRGLQWSRVNPFIVHVKSINISLFFKTMFKDSL